MAEFPVVDPQTQVTPVPQQRKKLYGPAHRRALWAAEENKQVIEAVAVDRAYTETQVLNDPASFEPRVQRQKAQNVEDAAIAALNEALIAQGTDSFGALTKESLESKTPEEKFKIASDFIDLVDFRRLTSRNVALLYTYAQGGDNIRVKVENFDQWRREELSPADIDAIKDSITEQQRRKARQDIDSYVATQGFANYGEMILNAGAQDFVPVFNVLSRLGLTKEMLLASRAKPVDGFKGLFTGEIKQALRDHLTRLPPAQYRQAVKDVVNVVKQWDGDPVVGPLLTKYNILEQFESVFTEGVLSGQDSENKVDRILSNIDIALESVLTAWFAGKFLGKTVKSGFRATDRVAAFTAARVAGQQGRAARLQEMLQNNELAARFGFEADETVPTLLPRPAAEFVDDIEELAESSKETLRRSERIRSEVLETTDGFTGAGLNVKDQANTITRTIREMDIADGHHVMPRMSTIRMFDNDSGFQIEAVVGETAERGWRTIEDVTDDVLQLDPNLERMEIVRVGPNGTLVPVFADRAEFIRAAFSRNFPASSAPNPPFRQDFYVRYKQDRFWHTADKQSLLPESILNSGWIPRFLLPPNAKFGDEIYGSFLRAYMNEQALTRDLEFMFQPYYNLGVKDKQFVNHVYEWMEDFAKDMVGRGEVGRAPTLTETLAQFDGITEKQLNGIIALREGMDTMHELFNRRLYREFNALGYKTARPSVATMPTYHGKVLTRDEVQAGMMLDPLTGELRQFSKTELDDLYNAGARVMKLDMAVDSSRTKRAKADLVVIDQGYEIGELSTKPLKYHPGYSMRFYDDPYFVVKKTSGVTLNGRPRAGKDAVESEAIWTAGTEAEARAKIKRIEAEPGVEWEVVRARDISQTENTLMQKQVIHREGRLFWDDRNFERLPDVNGNRARLMDPVKSLERGIGLASHQLAQEDLMKSLKGAFEAEYIDLPNRVIQPGSFATKSMKQIVADLKALKANTVDPVAKKRVKNAIELVNYMRLLSGTESTIIPLMREAAINIASTISRATGGKLKSRAVEKYFQTMDPLRSMRSIAFNAFMVFRPVRQALLQSAQVGYLAPLAPGYVASGRIFKDAYHLRRGIAARRLSGFDDGISVRSAAKAMGLTQREYRKLMKEFDRSGLLELVDVHSFSGGARRFHKVALPNSPLGTTGYKAKQWGVATKEFFQRFGFNFGERNNLTFTYALALQRKLKKQGGSLLDFKPEDWDALRTEASNLALGMVRPNNFGYQSGALSVATQFLSFSHKAALGLLGGNPAIKGADVLRILGGTYLLYGANMFGARDFVEEQLVGMGLRDAQIPGMDGQTLVDLISGGIIDNTFNALFDMTTEDWKDIDLAFLAPGTDVSRIWEMQLETLISQPAYKTAFGPFGNLFSKTLKSYEFVSNIMAGEPDLAPADKFLIAADAYLSGLLPQYNDAVMAYLGYQMNQWYSSSGEALPLRATMNGILARGLFGARTREELAYYRLQNKVWESKEDMDNIVRENKKHYIRLMNRWFKGEITDETLRRQNRMLTNMWEEFPEAHRQEILRRSMIEDMDNGDPSVIKQLIKGIEEHHASPDVQVLIDRFTDIPPAQREELKILAKEAYEGKLGVDQKTREILEEGQQ